MHHWTRQRRPGCAGSRWRINRVSNQRVNINARCQCVCACVCESGHHGSVRRSMCTMSSTQATVDRGRSRHRQDDRHAADGSTTSEPKRLCDKYLHGWYLCPCSRTAIVESQPLLLGDCRAMHYPVSPTAKSARRAERCPLLISAESSRVSGRSRRAVGESSGLFPPAFISSLSFCHAFFGLGASLRPADELIQLTQHLSIDTRN